MDSSLLVRRKNMLDLVAITVKRIVYVEYLTAGVAEHYAAPLLNQHSDNDISAG